MSPAKTAAPIEMPFGLRTRVGPSNHVLDGGSDPCKGRGNFEGERGIPLQSIGTLCGHLCKSGWVEDSGRPREPCIRWESRCLHDNGQLWGQWAPIVKYRDTLLSPVRKTAETTVMPFWLRTWTGPRNHKLDGVPIPHEKRQFWGKGSPTVKYRDFLPCAVHNGETDQFVVWVVDRRKQSSVVFTRWYQCVHMGGHSRHLANTTKLSVCGGDAVFCQITLSQKTSHLWLAIMFTYMVRLQQFLAQMLLRK